MRIDVFSIATCCLIVVVSASVLVFVARIVCYMIRDVWEGFGKDE